MATNFCPNEYSDACAQVLAENGVKSVRIEWGWAEIRWNNDGFNDPKRQATQIQALKKAGLRPLILLNAHHGIPGPMQNRQIQLRQDAKKGDREVILEVSDYIVPGRTGFTNLAGDYRAIYPIITSADAATGKCALSAPMPQDLKAGQQWVSRTRFRPFSGSVFADGKPNPDAQETADGWVQYVRTVCEFAREQLGTKGQPDAGFDLEVWNEMTFGSCFLDINNYYNPKLQFKTPLQYRGKNGREASGDPADDGRLRLRSRERFPRRARHERLRQPAAMG
jgi:hypothetical protein